MDVRNLIFPMTAGDLVQSAVVLAQAWRGDGPDIRALEVTAIGTTAEDGTFNVAFRDTVTYEDFGVSLKHDTPLLVTNIRRS